MSDPNRPFAGSIYSRTIVSPDGVWRVAYDYMDGEKSPLIISPQVTEIATGRIVLDLWRSIVDGSVDAFTATGFQVTLRDPYGPTVMVATVDARAETFVLADEPPTPHPVSELTTVVRARIDQARRDYLASLPPIIPPKPPTIWENLTRWFR